MNYRKATNDDINLLVEQRLKFIEIDKEDNRYETIKENCYLYFENALLNNKCAHEGQR